VLTAAPGLRAALLEDRLSGFELPVTDLASALSPLAYPSGGGCFAWSALVLPEQTASVISKATYISCVANVLGEVEFRDASAFPGMDCVVSKVIHLGLLDSDLLLDLLG
jgi:hypothetical protein